MRKGIGLSISLFALSLLFVNAGACAQNYRVIHSFSGGLDGAEPTGVALTAEGSLYGTTLSGGEFDYGTIFAIDPLGSKTILHNFQTGDGTHPFEGLLVADDGASYGTTPDHGAFGGGTVFKLDASGNFTVLYSFGARLNDGFDSFSTLVRDANGNLFGTTQDGGANGAGTVFKLDTSSNETTVHSFNFFDGEIPRTGVVMDSSGNLFGTTNFGGTGLVCGLIFKIDQSGNETVLHNFTCGADGDDSWSLLARDATGNLYGTAAQGGQYGDGVAFKLDAAGNETVLHAFSGLNGDGALPFGNLPMDASGNLYGTTAEGGSENSGILFKLDPNGNETILHTFTGQNGDGVGPRDLVLDAAGDIFGVTASGGLNGFGTVFEYSASPVVAIPSMLSYVNSLFTQRTINAGQDNSLAKKLQQIAKLVNAGKTSGAIDNLNLFISEVNDLLSSGVLTKTEAAGLIAGANSLIATLTP